MRSAEKSTEHGTEGAGATGHTKRRSQAASGSVRLRQADLLALLERQGRRCALSGRPLEPEAANLDHKKPLIRGGKHVVGNIQILHRDINRMKGSLTQAEFVQLCREVAAWADRATEAPAAEQNADLEG